MGFCHSQWQYDCTYVHISLHGRELQWATKACLFLRGLVHMCQFNLNLWSGVAWSNHLCCLGKRLHAMLFRTRLAIALHYLLLDWALALFNQGDMPVAASGGDGPPPPHMLHSTAVTSLFTLLTKFQRWKLRLCPSVISEIQRHCYIHCYADAMPVHSRLGADQLCHACNPLWHCSS